MDKHILLLLMLNVCHWAADYTHLSRPWMLAAKRLGTPIGPIAAHAFVHAVLMSLVCCLFAGIDGVIIALTMQFPTHWGIDILKGRLNGWFHSLQSPTNVYHWYVFGLDQLAHQVVIIAIAFAVIQ